MRPPPPPWGIRRDLTFIKANCPWLGVNNWSIVYTTWSDKRSNACPTTVKCVASYDIHASNPHLIPTSPQGRGVSRNNDRCITRRDATAVYAGDANSDALLLDMQGSGRLIQLILPTLQVTIDYPLGHHDYQMTSFFALEYEPQRRQKELYMYQTSL